MPLLNLAIEDQTLEDVWRDLLPGRWYRYSLKQALCEAGGYLSLGVPYESRREVYEEVKEFFGHQGAPQVLPLRILSDAGLGWPHEDTLVMLGQCLMRYAPEARNVEEAGRQFTGDLVEAARDLDVSRCMIFRRSTPLSQFLEALHGVGIGPQGAFTLEFVARFLWNWVDGFTHGGRWGDDELSALGLDGSEFAVDEPVDHFTLQARLLHLILLGGAFGLFDRAVVLVDDVSTLIRAPLLSSTERRIRAALLNYLLEELDLWRSRSSRRLDLRLTVILGWSGNTEDAVLLRHLHEPLMEKLHDSKLWIPRGA